MKKQTAFLVLAALISTTNLPADDAAVDEIADDAVVSEASTEAVKTSSEWQNWAVAGGAIVAAAIGVIVVATNK